VSHSKTNCCNIDDNLCKQKGETGMCRAYIPKYYYDNDTKKCTQFIWGGCGGNVPFNDLEDCENKCNN
jgi:hypothetical protein